MAKGSGRLLNLDLLRLVSALMVLFFHYGFRMRISGEGGGIGFPELAPLAQWGDTGLLVFFGISGYVIAMSAEGRPATLFAAGRIARLWPTFVVCATVTAIALTCLPLPTQPPPTFVQWAAHAVIISRALGQPFLDGAYWTIAYEIIFYCWVFLMIAAGLFERHWRIIVAAWLALSIANQTLIGNGAVEKVMITVYSGYFAFGLAVFRLRSSFSWTGLAVLIGAAAWACATPFMTEGEFISTYGMGRSLVGLALMGPAALLAVATAALLPSLPVRPTFAVTLGGLTYPLYLLHQNIGYAVFAHLGTPENRWGILGALIVALLLASLAVAKWVEPPARRAIMAIATRLQSGPLPNRKVA